MNTCRNSSTNLIDFSLGEFVIMQSFHDYSKNKFENEEKFLKKSVILNQNENNRTRRKYACSNKMMLNKLNKRNSQESGFENSNISNVNKFSNLKINERENSLNKSYDSIIEKKIEKDNSIENSFFCGDNNSKDIIEFKRGSSFGSKQINLNKDNFTLGANIDVNKILNNTYNFKENNCEALNEDISNNILNTDSFPKVNKDIQYSNTGKKYNEKNYCSKAYEEIKNSENFLEFLNYKIENYEKDMMEYLNTVKLDLNKAYKKFYQKVIKISTDKARRITQVFVKNKNSSSDYNAPFSKKESKSSISDFTDFRSDNKSTEKEKILEDNYLIDVNSNENQFANLNSLNMNLNLEDEKENNINKKENCNIKSCFIMNSSFKNPENLILNRELEDLKNFANKNITQKIDTMFELHENLMESIKQNFELMKNFLNDYEFNCLNPMQEFVNSNAYEICNSWFLPKVKSEKLNLNCILKNNNFPKIFRSYLINEDSENKFNKYSMEKSVNYDLDKRILKKNNLCLQKLVFDKFPSTNEIEKVFGDQEIQNLNFDKMNSVKFENSNLDYLSCLKGFKNTIKLQARKSFFREIPFNFSQNFPNLIKVYLRKCRLNNNGIQILLGEFEKLNKLEEINFSNNDITLFHYISPSNFKSLHTIILRKNKISKIYFNNRNIYPQLKVVDLSYNNILELSQIKELVEENKIMALISKNLAVYNDREGFKEYLIKMKEILLNSENKLRKLDLSHFFYTLKHNEDFHLKNLSLNKILLFNLKKLDLSFNNLYDEDLNDFFKGNRGFVNIKEINLQNNGLTENFFNILNELELSDLYEYLEVINLANNNINHYCLEAIIKAFQDSNNLKKIKLQNNPIENYFYMFLNRKLENKQRHERFIEFFINLEKLTKEKRKCLIYINHNTELFQNFSNEEKDLSIKFIVYDM